MEELYFQFQLMHVNIDKELSSDISWPYQNSRVKKNNELLRAINTYLQKLIIQKVQQ